MYISNATGCSSIWGGPAATSPYCANKEGHGPAWCNSLFEDNAEHGLGMYIGQNKIRQDLAEETRQLIAVEWARPELKAAAQAWLDTMEDGEANAEPAKAFVKALEDSICTVDELAAVPQFAEHAAQLKAKGALFCDCAACTIAADLLSKQMMDGEKWNTFVLQLSFIGWYLLCSITFGIGFIFLEPYVQATFAELYAALRAKALANGYTNEYELGGFVRH